MLKISGIILSFSLLAGCAHTISIHPELTQIAAPAAAKPSPRQVALYLADDLRSAKVTTPAGGGDSVTYYPYQDLEIALFKVLKNTFASAIRLTAPVSADELKRRDIHYLVTPLITTTSSSSRFALWAPTDFSVTLRLTLVDVVTGGQVSKEVVGEGKFDHATEMNYSSVAASHGSEAARRAAQDAVMKLQQALLNAPELR